MQTYTQLATLSPGMLGMFDGQHYLLFCLKEPITDELVAEWTADEKTIISAPGQRACTSNTCLSLVQTVIVCVLL